MIKDFAKLGLILAAFAAVACVGLAAVNGATEEQIKQNADKQVNESLSGLFPGAAGFEAVTSGLDNPSPDVKFESVFAAKGAEGVVGVAIKASGPSYGGTAVLLIGVDKGDKLVGVRVLDNKDTPGLGANASVPTYFVDKSSKTTFPGQFAGKPLSDAFEVKKDVQAITASTITSRALTKIVKIAGDAGAAWLAGAAGGN